MIVWIESLDSSRIHNQPRFNEVPKSWANELCLNKTLGSNIIFTLMSAPYLPIPYVKCRIGAYFEYNQTINTFQVLLNDDQRLLLKLCTFWF